jgi:ATP-binding cassette subfamily B (MDR/TAP) protein 1
VSDHSFPSDHAHTLVFSIYGAYALAFFFGGILVSRGQANSGIVVNVFFSIVIGSFSLAMLAPEMQAISKAQGAAAKLFQTIDRIPSIDSASPDGLRLEHVKGVISFENVKFHYPSRPNVPILRNYTATFEAGSTVALVGASGSGKSTIVALTERFYDPIQGTVYLDGHDIKTLNVKWLRQQIGLVSQEPTLFATSVRGNVEHGLIGSRWQDAPDAERFELVKKACIDANCHDFIMKLPNGYDTNVGERGMLLSGGQKQRVAIARAIVSDPKILLLDEATSALDTQSEGIVQDALDKAAQGRTTITIAHRLSTIKDADMILVMGGGEILESGNHNSLVADPESTYAQLVNNQKLNQVAATGPMADTEEEEAALRRMESPKSEKFPGLNRATTGRSLASAAMEDVQARKAEDEAEDDKIPSQWGLFIRLFKLNKDQKWFYVAGTIGAVCAGMVYPCIAIVFGYALSDFEIQDPQALRSKMRQNA